MTLVDFPEANTKITPPNSLEESQCSTAKGYHGIVQGPSSVEGLHVIVVAWKPDPMELERIKAGGAIFLSCLGGIPPHFLSTSFEEGAHPA